MKLLLTLAIVSGMALAALPWSQSRIAHLKRDLANAAVHIPTFEMP